MVVLLVPDLSAWFDQLVQIDLTPVTFREPDLDWRTTALAVAVPQGRRSLFSALRLC